MPTTRRAASLGLAAALSLGRASMAEAGTADYPTIVARIGMGLDELKAGSSYPLQLARVTDSDLTVATEPNIFKYLGPYGFTLPPGRLVTLYSTAAVISAAEVSPHLDPLRLDDAIGLTQKIEQILSSADWKREDQNMVGIEELRIRVRDSRGSDQARWPVARMVLGPVETVLAIKRIERASRLGGLLGAGDAYIVRVEMADESLGRSLDRIAATLNSEDGTLLPRVVALEPYLVRVRAMLREGGVLN